MPTPAVATGARPAPSRAWVWLHTAALAAWLGIAAALVALTVVGRTSHQPIVQGGAYDAAYQLARDAGRLRSGRRRASAAGGGVHGAGWSVAEIGAGCVLLTVTAALAFGTLGHLSRVSGGIAALTDGHQTPAVATASVLLAGLIAASGISVVRPAE
jgi:hypothetical protein